MAATLTGSGETTTTYFSFPIEKMETTDDGDLLVYGKATDGSVDHDQQIVDPGFSSKAIAEWLATGGNVRVQHSPQRDPAGIGIEAHTDESGATWVKSLVIEPIAKKLVSKGALRAYSVGIANPTIERDMTGKARGGIIKAGQIVEISLVDRPANASCGIRLVKSIDGAAEYTGGEVFGTQKDIAKALGVSVAKDAGPAVAAAVNDITDFMPPADISIDFTPNDLMKILQDKMVRRAQEETRKAAGYEPFPNAVKRDFDANVGGGVDRDKLPESDFAGRNRSFPIVTQADVSDALQSIGRAGADNYSHEELRRRIIEIARRKGFSVPEDDKKKDKAGDAALAGVVKADPDHDGDNDSTPEGDTDHDYWTAGGKQKKPLPGKPMPKKKKGVKADEPDLTKKPKDKKKKKAGKKMPPWLDKPSGEACKINHVHTAKCHTDPKTASHAAGPNDMKPAPVGELEETPAKPHMKAYSDVMLRYKTIGIDAEMGKLHDFTCPAYNPDEVHGLFPDASFGTLVDDVLWQQKALSAAAGKSLAEAVEAQQAWQASIVLKNADPRDLYDFRWSAHKAFRDANPGPSSALTPGRISADRFNRPLITAGHESSSPGHDGATVSARLPQGAPSADHFQRPPLNAGHETPSPSFMKGGFPYPSQQGVPSRLDYPQLEKEKARRALSMLHDHLMHMFPSVCPMLDQDAYRVETPGHSPAAIGAGKNTGGTEPYLGDVSKLIAKLEKKVRQGRISEREAREELSRRTAEKYARSLSKQVKKGVTSTNEVLKALGLPGEYPFPAGRDEVPPARVPAPEQTGPGFSPDVMKSMMAEALKPFEEKIDLQGQHIEKQNGLLSQYQDRFEAQESELAEHRQRWEALANSPDPASNAFTGLALSPAAKGAHPAGVVQKADTSERITGMMIRQLERAWRTSENPAEREAAYSALQKYKGQNPLDSF